MDAKENLIRTIRRDNPGWVPFRYDGALALLRSAAINVRPVSGGKDDWGVTWLYTNEEEGSYPDGRPVVDIEQADNLSAPGTDWNFVTADMRRQVEECRRQGRLAIAYDELLIFERAQLLLGFEGFMLALIECREELNALVGKIFEYNRKFVTALLDSGVDGIRFTDDWGMQDRLFISPADWRFFFKERYRELYSMVKARGGFVFQHSCGCLTDIMPDIVEIGVDVLDPCQPSANDIAAYKEQFGDRLSFMGALDTQTWLTFGTAEEAYQKTTEMLFLMSKNGGYIPAPSHTIAIPQENRAAMLRAVEDYNKNLYLQM